MFTRKNIIKLMLPILATAFLAGCAPQQPAAAPKNDDGIVTAAEFEEQQRIQQQREAQQRARARSNSGEAVLWSILIAVGVVALVM